MLKLIEPKQKKMKLGRHPYTFVRTVVMRTLLFKKEQYDKLLKMDFNEIARILQESHYSREINTLATEHSGADLLELALNKSLAASFDKLIRISSKELETLIREYAKRKDIDDIKTILRGKFTGTDEKIIANSLTAAGTLSMDFLMSLMKKDSVEDILKNLKIADFSLFQSGLKELKEKNSLVAIEHALDKFYYSELMEFSKTLPEQGNLFRKFLEKEIEILNFLTLLRLKKSKADTNFVRSCLILQNDKNRDAKLLSLANFGIDDLLKSLEKTEYKGAIKNGLEEFRKSGSLIKIETDLYKLLLKQSTLLLHQHPLSIDVILGYMFAKDIETRNLRIIIKGKQLGLGEEFISSQLVYG